MLWRISVGFGVAAGLAAWGFSNASNTVLFACAGMVASIVAASSEALFNPILSRLDELQKDASGSSVFLTELSTTLQIIRRQSIILLLVGGMVKLGALGLFIALLTGKVDSGNVRVVLTIAWGACAFAMPLALQQFANYVSAADAIAEKKIRAQREKERAERMAAATQLKTAPDLSDDEHLKSYHKIVPLGPISNISDKP